MSVVMYNGVTLPYAFHTSFKQEAIGDDMGNTDWFCTKYDIEVQAVVNSNYWQLLVPDLPDLTNPDQPPSFTEGPADIMNVIRYRLLQRRRAFSLKFNGVEMVPQATAVSPPSSAGTVDVQNGPIPKSCVITALNNTTFLITWHVIAHYWENDTYNAQSPLVTNNKGNPVLYNRWTEEVDLDENGFSTRTRSGKLVIRSDNQYRAEVDLFRNQMAVTGVPAGFRRVSSKYTVTPNGLALQYVVVDKEAFKMPPPPSYRAEGEYIESSTNKGARRWGQCRVRLWGSKDTDQGGLVLVAIAVATKKLRINGADLSGSGITARFSWLDAGVIMTKLYENEVEVLLRVLMKPAGPSPQQAGIVGGVWGLRLQNLAYTPLSDDVIYTPPYSCRGTASLLLHAAAYYDPSLKSTVLNRMEGQLTAGLEVGVAGVVKEP
jgi:hypothetical protein